MLRECKRSGKRIYNLPHYENPSRVIEEYEGEIVHVRYREGTLSNNDWVQFMDSKRKILSDKIEDIRVAGQSQYVCINQLVDLISGNSTRQWPGADLLGWQQNIHQKVITTPISTRKITSVIV